MHTYKRREDKIKYCGRIRVQLVSPKRGRNGFL